MPVPIRRRTLGAALTALLTPVRLVSGAMVRPAAAATGTTAWQNGSFALYPGGVVSRSTWVDNTQTGSSGQTFGAMSAITTGGQDVAASVTGSTQVQVAFNR